jgi:hypothetical protein
MIYCPAEEADGAPVAGKASGKCGTVVWEFLLSYWCPGGAHDPRMCSDNHI